MEKVMRHYLEGKLTYQDLVEELHLFLLNG